MLDQYCSHESFEEHLRVSVLPQLLGGGSVLSGLMMGIVGAIYQEQAAQAAATNVAVATVAGLSESYRR